LFLERVMGLEPTTTALATRCSTTELHPHRVSELWGFERRGSSGPRRSRRASIAPSPGRRLGSAQASGSSRAAPRPSPRASLLAEEIRPAEHGQDLEPRLLETLPAAFLAVDEHDRPARRVPDLLEDRLPSFEDRASGGKDVIDERDLRTAFRRERRTLDPALGPVLLALLSHEEELDRDSRLPREDARSGCDRIRSRRETSHRARAQSLELVENDSADEDGSLRIE